MRTSLVILVALAVVGAAGCGSTSKHSAKSKPSSSGKAPKAHEPVMYGHVIAMTRTGKQYELRFDPALWLTGVSAQRAAKEDTGSSDVPGSLHGLAVMCNEEHYDAFRGLVDAVRSEKPAFDQRFGAFCGLGSEILARPAGFQLCGQKRCRKSKEDKRGDGKSIHVPEFARRIPRVKRSIWPL